MTDLARETMSPANEPTSDHHSPADAGSEGDDQRVRRTSCRADPPLGPGRTVRVVVDRNQPSESLGQTTGSGEVLDTGQIRRRHDHSLARHEARHSEPDVQPGIDGHPERLDEFDENFFESRRTPRRRDSLPLDDGSTRVDHNGQTLRSTDVDTKTQT